MNEQSGSAHGASATPAPRAEQEVSADRSARRRRALIALVLTVLGMLAVWVLVIVLAPGENTDGQCGGIGFGCSLSPKETLLFFTVFYGPPTLLGIVAVGALATASLLRCTRWGGRACGVVGGVGSAVVVFVVALLLLGLL